VRHWSREGPPAYIGVAAYLGLRRPSPAASDVLEGQDLLNFLGAFSGAGGPA
jgi:hypothetical protein